MGVNESIREHANASITISRRGPGTYDDDAGAYVKAAPTTLGPFDVVIQPAYNMNRVIGGTDIEATRENQRSDKVLVMYCEAELVGEEEVATRDDDHAPDIVHYKGKEYVVIRCEEWDDSDEDDSHFRAIISKVTGGGT